MKVCADFACCAAIARLKPRWSKIIRSCSGSSQYGTSRQSSMLKKSLLNKPGFFEIGRRFGCSEWSVKRYDEFSTTEAKFTSAVLVFRGAFFETGADVTFF